MFSLAKIPQLYTWYKDHKEHSQSIEDQENILKSLDRKKQRDDSDFLREAHSYLNKSRQERAAYELADYYGKPGMFPTGLNAYHCRHKR